VARYTFGGDTSSFVYTRAAGGGLYANATTLTFWSAKTSGTQYTDLLDSAGAAATSIAVGTDGLVPEFSGPDGIDTMWADPGTGTRERMVRLPSDANLTATYGTLSQLWAGTPSGGNSSYFDLTHNTNAGYLLHVHTGASMAGPAALIGVGVGDAGATDATGILISQKSASSGDAILLANQSGTTGKAFHGQQNATAGTFMYLEQTAGGVKDLLRLVTNSVPIQSQAQAIFQVGVIAGRAGYIMADTGDIIWQNEVRAQGADFVAEEQSGAANPAQVHISGAQGYYPSFRDGATTSGSTTFTSATATFAAGDTGKTIMGAGIPAGTTITYVNATTVTLSNAATATATGVKFLITRSGTANNPRVSFYRYSGATGKHFSWRVGMTSGTSTTALEFVANNGAVAPGLETPAIKGMTLDYASGAAKIGLYGATAVAQPTRVGALTDSTTGTATTTIGDVGAAFSQSGLNNIHASLLAKINSLEAKLSAAAGGIGVTA
jgi:hypothetical protein